MNLAQTDANYFRERLEAWQDANRDMGDRFAKVIEQRAMDRDAFIDVLREIAALDTSPKAAVDALAEAVTLARVALDKVGGKP